MALQVTLALVKINNNQPLNVLFLPPPAFISVDPKFLIRLTSKDNFVSAALLTWPENWKWKINEGNFLLFLLGFYDRFLGIARESLTLMSPKKIYNWDLIDLKAWIIWKNPLLAFKFLTKKAVMYPSSQKAITPKKKERKRAQNFLILYLHLIPL